MTCRTIRLYTAFSAALLIAVAACPISARGEIRNRLTLGFDSFIDRFTIVDVDTAESVHEYYIGLGNDLRFKSDRAAGGLNNFFRAGTQTIDEHIDGEISLLPVPSTRVDIRSFFHFKHFQESSDYTFGNDYLQSNTLLKIRRTLGEGSKLTLRGRFEGVDYERQNQFDYDYYYYDSGLEFEAGSFLRRLIRVGGFVGHKEAPDTTEMNYERAAGEIEMQFTAGESGLLHIYTMGDRRDYRGTVRSSYWLVLSQAEFMITSLGGRSLSVRFESEYTAYDDPTPVFFDNHFVRCGAGVKIPLRERLSMNAEPRVARMFCRDYAEERYREYTVLLGVELFGGNDFWLIAGYEPGYRDYISDTNALYSDFYLNRLSLMGSIPLSADFYVNVFAMHDPEKHMR
ncbi:MAG TPA: hypothetical protein ENO08_04375, partial [Candidatus Eisenbacteria bacterium]|nr:hypothetical protein [Candidatus Eisenbacteria bacterium]